MIANAKSYNSKRDMLNQSKMNQKSQKRQRKKEIKESVKEGIEDELDDNELDDDVEVLPTSKGFPSLFISPISKEFVPTSSGDSSVRKEKSTPLSRTDSVSSSVTAPSIPNGATLNSHEKEARSPVWQVVDNVTKQCRKCLFTFSSSTGTGSIKNHLWSSHKIKVEGDKLIDMSAENDKSQKQLFFNKAGNLLTTPYTAVFNQHTSEKLLMKFIIAEEQPISLVEKDSFNRYSEGLNKNFKMPSMHVLKRNIIDYYHSFDRWISEYCKGINSRCSFTTDLWTSNQTYSYMSVTMHFIDKNWMLKHFILDFIPFEHNHKGSNIGDQLWEVLRKRGLCNSILTIVSDNASNNDTAIDYIIDLMKKTLNVVLIHNGDFLRGRCWPHIINIIIKAAFELIAALLGNLRGHINKLHASSNLKLMFFHYAKESYVELETDDQIFKRMRSIHKQPSLDCITRWSSTYEMISSAYPYRNTFTIWNAYLKGTKNELPPITKEDWDNVETLMKFLKPFKDCTARLSVTKQPTINLVYFEYTELVTHLDQYRKLPGANASSVTNTTESFAKIMTEKILTYWDASSNLEPIYAIAHILDPRFKTRYMTEVLNLEKKVVESYVTFLKSLVDYYSDEFGNEPEKLPFASAAVKMETDELFNHPWFMDNSSQPNQNNEVGLYLSLNKEPHGKHFDILQWWKVNEGTFPNMAKIARDILSVPASSISSESAFSGSGRLISKNRASLKPEFASMLMKLKCWEHEFPHHNWNPDLDENRIEELEKYMIDNDLLYEYFDVDSECQPFDLNFDVNSSCSSSEKLCFVKK